MHQLILYVFAVVSIALGGCRTTGVDHSGVSAAQINDEPTREDCFGSDGQGGFYGQWKRLHPDGKLVPSPVGYDQTKMRMSFCPLADEQIEAMRKHTAEFNHRVWHIRWHGIRGIWNNDQFKDIVQFVKDNYPGWVVNEKNYFGAQYRDNKKYPNNKQGIDFLYMHKIMFDMLNDTLASEHLPPVVGWMNIPKNDSKLFPITTDESYYPHSTKAGQNIENWEATYQTRAYLKSVTLSQMGYDIEVTIHNLMHMRFALKEHKDAMDGDLFKKWEEYSTEEQDKMRYDGPQDAHFYDWLGDPFSSAVNPNFWKLHGWINNRLEQWMSYNQTICVTGNELVENHSPDHCQITYPLADLFVGTLPTATTSKDRGSHDGHFGADIGSTGKSIPKKLAAQRNEANKFVRQIFMLHHDQDAGAQGDNFIIPNDHVGGAHQSQTIDGLGNEIKSKKNEIRNIFGKASQ